MKKETKLTELIVEDCSSEKNKALMEEKKKTEYEISFSRNVSMKTKL